MKKSIRFPKNVHTLRFPTNNWNALEAMERIKDYYKLPKYRIIGFNMEMKKGKGGYCVLDVYIIK